MAKDPAFLFYPGDWLGGTLGMTLEQKGAYMEVLMLQFNRGHMTTHMIGQVIGQNWLTIQDKFIQDEKGLWYNPRLEEEINKRKKFVSSRKNNISGTNQHSKQKGKSAHKNGHMTSHMENENENENIDSNYIMVSGKKITDPLEVLDFYEAQLNGTQKENGNLAWRPLVPGWMAQHIGEDFTDASHVKNSFKKYYLQKKPGGSKPPRVKAFEL